MAISWDIIFSELLNRALIATWLMLAAVLFRVLFSKAPKRLQLLLWALAAVRLVFSVDIKFGLSLVPSARVLDYQTAQYAASPALQTGFAALDGALNPAFSKAFAGAPAASANPLQLWMGILGLVWGAGVGVMLLWAIVSYLRVKRRVRAAIEKEPGVMVCDGLETPFLLGVFRPRIYLPSELPENEARFVLAHERAHLQHRDGLWKIIGFILLCTYWFYPPVWLCYALFCRDLELACDERVAESMTAGERKQYAQTLLSCSVPRGNLTVCPLAFGEVGVKERVRRVLEKRPGKLFCALAVAVCILVAVCFLTNPETPIYGLSEGEYRAGELDMFDMPTVIFQMSGGEKAFSFSVSPLSSYLLYGDYTIEDGFVTCSDGQDTLVFQIKDNDTIVLQMPGEKGFSMQGYFVPNGTEFSYVAP